jgi:hypothetical protein
MTPNKQKNKHLEVLQAGKGSILDGVDWEVLINEMFELRSNDTGERAKCIGSKRKFQVRVTVTAKVLGQTGVFEKQGAGTE